MNTSGTTASGLCPKLETSMSMVRFCIEGRDVTKLGPQNVVDLNEVIRDAIVRGGGDTWSVQESCKLL